MENLIYLNEKAVNEELASQYKGELTERVERINKTKGAGVEAGGEVAAPIIGPLMGKLKAAVSANYEKGKEEEFVYNLQDKGAKFELLMEILEDTNATWVREGLSLEDRDNLRMDIPIILDAPIVSTPLNELIDKFNIGDDMKQAEEAMKDISQSGLFDEEKQDEWMEMSNEAGSLEKATSGTQKLLSSMSSEEIYRLPLGKKSGIDFVMKLQDKWLENPPLTFPSSKSDYITVGRVTSKVSEGESKELVSWLDLAGESSNDRNEKRLKTKQLKGDLAEMASEQLDREVSLSEFNVSHPDVQLHPLAIYALN